MFPKRTGLHGDGTCAAKRGCALYDGLCVFKTGQHDKGSQPEESTYFAGSPGWPQCTSASGRCSVWKYSAAGASDVRMPSLKLALATPLAASSYTAGSSTALSSNETKCSA